MQPNLDPTTRSVKKTILHLRSQRISRTQLSHVTSKYDINHIGRSHKQPDTQTTRHTNKKAHIQPDTQPTRHTYYQTHKQPDTHTSRQTAQNPEEYQYLKVLVIQSQLPRLSNFSHHPVMSHAVPTPLPPHVCVQCTWYK